MPETTLTLISSTISIIAIIIDIYLVIAIIKSHKIIKELKEKIHYMDKIINKQLDKIIENTKSRNQ